MYVIYVTMLQFYNRSIYKGKSVLVNITIFDLTFSFF